MRTAARVIEIKRRNTDGTYETDWQDVETLSGLKTIDAGLGAINYSLSNSDYNFGMVNVGNVTITFNSKNGQFDDEGNRVSIFFGYLRHRSLIRIRDGYVDPTTSDDVLTTVFEGFIDATATGTKVDDENLKQSIQCVDLLSFLLKFYTISDMGTLTSTTLSDLIYEILNRSEFTDFFTVSAVNIVPGYDILTFDIAQYEGQTQLFTLFENFSVGHSFFYVRDEIFYYQEITSAATNDLVIDEKKLIRFSSYANGLEKVFERWYWSNDDTVSYESAENTYNRSKTIEIDGVQNATDRQAVLNAVGVIAKTQKESFTIEIPYYPNVFILEKITVSSPELIPSDAIVWGITRWGESGKVFRQAISANNIYTSKFWRVKSVKHTASGTNYKTVLNLEEIV